METPADNVDHSLLTIEPSFVSDVGSEHSSVRSSPYPRVTVHRCAWTLLDSTLCGRPFTDPEALYTHLTEEHVGRKTTGNLCLYCRVHGCPQGSTAFSKRDHITSHLRSHVPLKANPCETCTKSFKWPHDLRKHYMKTGHGPVGDRASSDTSSLSRSASRKSSVSRKGSISRRRSIRSSHSSINLPQSVDLSASPALQPVPDVHTASSPHIESDDLGLFHSASYGSVYSGSSVGDDHSDWSEGQWDERGSHFVGVPEEYNPVDVHLLSRYLADISLPSSMPDGNGDYESLLSPQLSSPFGEATFSGGLGDVDGLAGSASGEQSPFVWPDADVPRISVSGPVAFDDQTLLFPPHPDQNYLPDTVENDLAMRAMQALAHVTDNEMTVRALANVADNEMTVRPSSAPPMSLSSFAPGSSPFDETPSPPPPTPFDPAEGLGSILDNEATVRPISSQSIPSTPLFSDATGVDSQLSAVDISTISSFNLERAFARMTDCHATVRPCDSSRPPSLFSTVPSIHPDMVAWPEDGTTRRPSLFDQLENHGDVLQEEDTQFETHYTYPDLNADFASISGEPPDTEPYGGSTAKYLEQYETEYFDSGSTGVITSLENLRFDDLQVLQEDLAQLLDPDPKTGDLHSPH
ncbi:uncharacterized protein SPPG_00129 [Spizellomyces punctatus DAOM BR117]|uniref:C2H2-type domain-containing protein n=1 Tax=Spizellomyces punctatus (strain DAOM BR117) TaxID=645134 RepID=A0A0L0HTF1_SPIPD|nr:uncharacterized protein SPPG_00129 [Spizellomyces punctatus DAOM BR117]KND04398.1 hypothetical protein SPPG_00129 [Spizellomyces punctatus DAOM BR117]|eukprot:XP_016612437.1 hypothetical protein SPPG_00129 [Spizellomyces punctatus DAOM BR117]